MKSFCITLSNHVTSELGFTNLVKSSIQFGNDFTIEKFDAVTPKIADEVLKDNDLVWNYPWDETILDKQTGLLKTPYSAKNPKTKIACALSHYLLWKKCVEIGEPILILEHDAIFTKTLVYDYILKSNFKIVGINDPIKATRKANLFNSIVQNTLNDVQQVPRIDDIKVPQGLAGNSAYIVTPEACKIVVEKVKEVGLWHNDALLCFQLFDFLGVTKTYYTKVQGLPSTSTL